jgi:hypothetical protein
MSTKVARRRKEMLFIDPVPFSMIEWRAALFPGFQFDYGENDLCVTVEVRTVRWGEMVELGLLVVDDAHSRAEPPREGDRFTASFLASTFPFYVWMAYPEGHWRRFAAWRREENEP